MSKISCQTLFNNMADFIFYFLNQSKFLPSVCQVPANLYLFNGFNCLQQHRALVSHSNTPMQTQPAPQHANFGFSPQRPTVGQFLLFAYTLYDYDIHVNIWVKKVYDKTAKGEYSCHLKVRKNFEPFESCAIIPLIQITLNGGAESRLMSMTVLLATTIEKPGDQFRVVFAGLLLLYKWYPLQVMQRRLCNGLLVAPCLHQQVRRWENQLIHSQ